MKNFSDEQLFEETPGQLINRVSTDMVEILNNKALPLSKRLDEVEWRQEFVKEFCFE